MDTLKMSVIKEEFGDTFTTPLEGWNAVTGDIDPRPLPSLTRVTTPQPVSNQFSPPASNHSSTSTFSSSNVDKTYASVASVRANPTNARQGLVKKVERNNSNRPFITTRNNKSVPIGSKLSQQTSTKLPFNFELQLRQTQEQLKEVTAKLVGNRNAYEVLEKKYDELKLDYLEFKSNANMQLDTLQIDNDKLNDELNQVKHRQVTLLAQINVQTPTETSQANAHIYIEQEIVDEDQVGQNGHCGHPSQSNATEMQIKQEFSDDDDSLSNQAIDILSGDQLNSNNISISQCIAGVNENVSQFGNGQIEAINNNLTDESAHHEVIDANVDQQFTQLNESKANTNEVVDEDQENADLNDEEAMSNTTNDNHVHSVVESNESSTSAQQQTNQIASTQPTGSNRRNPTKRKQSQSNRSVKRTKKTVEDVEEEEENNATNNDQGDKKIKVHYLNCTQPNCDAKLNTLDQYYGHLHNKHGLLPLQCFCGCKTRFANSRQISLHLRDRSAVKFSCPVCSKVCKSQNITTHHWFENHQTGQFQCNIDPCSKVAVNRALLYVHHQNKHRPNRHQCPHNGCSASFAQKCDLNKHERIHLNTRPFHCKWPQCVHRTNQRVNLIKHIRGVHFKKQQTNNDIESDPNKYVRVLKK